MYCMQEQIDRANGADLADFLQVQGEQLERAGNEYRWKRHDSLTVRGNKWYRHSQSKGGGPIDFVMEFYGRSFLETVQLLTGEQGKGKPEQTSPPFSDFRLPSRNPDPGQVNLLTCYLSSVCSKKTGRNTATYGILYLLQIIARVSLYNI